MTALSSGEEQTPSESEEEGNHVPHTFDDSADAAVAMAEVDDDGFSEVDGAPSSQPDDVDAVAADTQSDMAPEDARLLADLRTYYEWQCEAARWAIAAGDTALKFNVKKAVTVLLENSEPTNHSKFDPSVANTHFEKV